MKKNCIVILVLVFISCLCSGQDVKWQVVEETEVYTYQSSKPFIFEMNILEGQIVKPLSTFRMPENNDFFKLYFEIEYTNNEYEIPVESVIPYGTKDLLPESLLTPTLRKNGKDWFSAIYLDILYSGDRETALKFSPNAIKEYEKVYGPLEYEGPWWDPMFSISDPSELFQTVLKIDNFHNSAVFYIIGTVQKTNKFEVTVVSDKWYMNDTSIPDQLRPLYGTKSEGKILLTLQEDGDYLNIYVDSSYLLGSYVKMDRNFKNIFGDFVETNDQPDLSEITWPRHADGSCDYDNKRIITVQQDSRYRTIDNLRLRSAEETSSDILTTLEKGTIVTVLSLGKEDTIDGIQSNWVKVKLEDGTTGWCFGGYLNGPILESIAVPVFQEKTEPAPAPAPEKIVSPLKVTKVSDKFVDLTIPFLIILTVLVIWITTLVVIRKRKKT